MTDSDANATTELKQASNPPQPADDQDTSAPEIDIEPPRRPIRAPNPRGPRHPSKNSTSFPTNQRRQSISAKRPSSTKSNSRGAKNIFKQSTRNRSGSNISNNNNSNGNKKHKRTNDPNFYEMKIILVGSQGIGKSCVMNRFVSNEYTSELEGTVGVAFNRKMYTVRCKDGHIRVKYKLFDVSGQEKFQPLAKTYSRDATWSLVFYDITSEYSFKNAKDWVKKLKECYIDGDNKIEEEEEEFGLHIGLIGNKCDKGSKHRQIPFSHGKEFADENNVKFVEISAKTGEGVKPLFISLAQEYLTHVVNSNVDGENKDGNVNKSESQGKIGKKDKNDKKGKAKTEEIEIIGESVNESKLALESEKQNYGTVNYKVRGFDSQHASYETDDEFSEYGDSEYESSISLNLEKDLVGDLDNLQKRKSLSLSKKRHCLVDTYNNQQSKDIDRMENKEQLDEKKGKGGNVSDGGGITPPVVGHEKNISFLGELAGDNHTFSMSIGVVSTDDEIDNENGNCSETIDNVSSDCEPASISTTVPGNSGIPVTAPLLTNVSLDLNDSNRKKNPYAKYVNLVKNNDCYLNTDDIKIIRTFDTKAFIRAMFSFLFLPFAVIGELIANCVSHLKDDFDACDKANGINISDGMRQSLASSEMMSQSSIHESENLKPNTTNDHDNETKSNNVNNTAQPQQRQHSFDNLKEIQTKGGFRIVITPAEEPAKPKKSIRSPIEIVTSPIMGAIASPRMSRLGVQTTTATATATERGQFESAFVSQTTPPLKTAPSPPADNGGDYKVIDINSNNDCNQSLQGGNQSNDDMDNGELDAGRWSFVYALNLIVLYVFIVLVFVCGFFAPYRDALSFAEYGGPLVFYCVLSLVLSLWIGLESKVHVEQSVIEQIGSFPLRIMNFSHAKNGINILSNQIAEQHAEHIQVHSNETEIASSPHGNDSNNKNDINGDVDDTKVSVADYFSAVNNNTGNGISITVIQQGVSITGGVCYVLLTATHDIDFERKDNVPPVWVVCLILNLLLSYACICACLTTVTSDLNNLVGLVTNITDMLDHKRRTLASTDTASDSDVSILPFLDIISSNGDDDGININLISWLHLRYMAYINVLPELIKIETCLLFLVCMPIISVPVYLTNSQIDDGVLRSFTFWMGFTCVYLLFVAWFGNKLNILNEKQINAIVMQSNRKLHSEILSGCCLIQLQGGDAASVLQNRLKSIKHEQLICQSINYLRCQAIELKLLGMKWMNVCLFFLFIDVVAVTIDVYSKK